MGGDLLNAFELPAFALDEAVREGFDDLLPLFEAPVFVTGERAFGVRFDVDEVFLVMS